MVPVLPVCPCFLWVWVCTVMPVVPVVPGCPCARVPGWPCRYEKDLRSERIHIWYVAE